MTDLPFLKVEGLGNDFVLLDLREGSLAAAGERLAGLRTAAPALCDRRRGIGADGILVVAAPTTAGADATMWVLNHDGSRPEMCGNGLRCVALHVADAVGRDRLVVDTDAGPRRCTVVRGDPVEVEVDMGPGRDEGSRRPAAARGRTFAAVSMGNPHAIAFVADGEDPEALARAIGPEVEVDPAFPGRTNVELARVEVDGRLTLWVWERGVGITDACGTGACATACAACWSGRVPTDVPIRVDLPGGTLWVTVPEDRARGVLMRGAARVVFSGLISV